MTATFRTYSYVRIIVVLLLISSFYLARTVCADSPKRSKYPLKEGYPVWFYNPAYEDYLAGAIGTAISQPDRNYYKQKQLAKRLAEQELARQISVIVESELSIEKKLLQKGMSEEVASSIKSIYRFDSKELLKNAVIKDEWLNPETGELSVWIVIERHSIRDDAGNFDKYSGLIKGVTAEGSSAVVNMSAEQSQLVALQRARAAAIEKSSGIEVVSTTLITNFKLSMDLIKTYSKGYIVREKVKWLPLGQYQKNASTAPIPEYRVKIVADVYLPEKKIAPIELSAKLNNTVFRNGEKANIQIMVERDAKVAIFNFTAKDKVVMLFPNEYESDNAVLAGDMFEYPAKNSVLELKLQTLPDHKQDAEAVFVVAMDKNHKNSFLKMFKPFKNINFSNFFKKYSKIADYTEEAILPYEVINR